ncbi:hypothetical protein MPLSOD_40722 [Mesorhizobium sp. SOD10]|nr:hypothetical protein MPLSOD_40722 [Mesorhizobium sp. SOD10]
MEHVAFPRQGIGKPAFAVKALVRQREGLKAGDVPAVIIELEL